MDLALFDFDGTITNKDTFTDFLIFVSSPTKIRLGRILLFPILMAYKTGLISPERTRQIITRFAIKNHPINDLTNFGKKFAQSIIPEILKFRAIKQLNWHKRRGDLIVVVSASLNVYLEPWCKNQNIDVICTRLEFKNERATGDFLPTGCSGKEKVRRIKDRFDLDEFNTIYAYGDTREDNEMLQIADIKYFRWKEVDHLSKNGKWRRESID